MRAIRVIDDPIDDAPSYFEEEPTGPILREPLHTEIRLIVYAVECSGLAALRDVLETGDALSGIGRRVYAGANRLGSGATADGLIAEAKLSRSDPIESLVIEAIQFQAPIHGEISNETEALALARSLVRSHQEAKLGTTAQTESKTTDLANARRFAEQYGDNLRFCHPWSRWFVWDGSRFKGDDTAQVVRWAKATARSIYQEAAWTQEGEQKALARHAIASANAQRISAMIELARSEDGVPVLPNDFDADPWILTCPNGAVDLRSGDLRDNRRTDLVTKLCPVRYDPEATAPRWEQFLVEIMPDAATRDFLQRAVGYSLTGSTQEQCLFINFGGGANGKTTFVETLLALAGDYGMLAPTSMLLSKKSDGIPNDIAALKGARFVAAAEADAGRYLSEALVKQLTGSDTISARYMRGEFFTFQPVCKLWLSTNHKPLIRGTDEAIWRRIRLIPFQVTFSKDRRDANLAATLREELPGILAWAVRGALLWTEKGLEPPDTVIQATGKYREEMDVLADFFAEETQTDPRGRVMARQLFDVYSRWCEKNGEKAISKKAFGLALEERGYGAERTTASRYWLGIALQSEGGRNTVEWMAQP